jgi:hypothetical protein
MGIASMEPLPSGSDNTIITNDWKMNLCSYMVLHVWLNSGKYRMKIATQDILMI